MEVSRSSRLYAERRGRVPTRRRPARTFVCGGNAAHRYPLAEPLPLPTVLRADGRATGPDHAASRPWPTPAS